MGLSEQTIEVITRRLPSDKIKQRPGSGGMTFDYVTPDVVIEILNEAFTFAWSSRIFDYIRDENTVIVGIELTASDETTGVPVVKQQYGSCDITRGLGVGEAFKGAASDELKKAATLFGVALELYQDDSAAPPAVPSTSGKTAPAVPRPAAKTASAPPPRPAPPSPPRSVPSPTPASTPPTSPDNPFEGDSPTTTASVPTPRPAAARPTAAPAPPKEDPFGGTSGGISPTQISALTNIATRLEKSQSELIALANIIDAEGNVKTSFDALDKDQAIQVIRAAQQ